MNTGTTSEDAFTAAFKAALSVTRRSFRNQIKLRISEVF